VQPRSLSTLGAHPLKVMVFLGARQKVDVDLANAMQVLGSNASYVQICGNGRNALDFHIAFTLGELAADAGSRFYVMSKDTGFDPLLRYLHKRGTTAVRLSSLDDLATAIAPHDKVDAVLCNLASRGNGRPRRVKTLANTIRTLFPPDMPDCEVESLIAALEREGHISITDGAVSYR
jgi:hypothetical protein